MLNICVLCATTMVDWQHLSDYPFAPLAKINAVCSLQLSPREGHHFNLLYMSQKAMACIKSTLWQISCGNPFLVWELVAYCPCPCSKAVQELVLPQEFGGRYKRLRKKRKKTKGAWIKGFPSCFLMRRGEIYLINSEEDSIVTEAGFNEIQ